MFSSLNRKIVVVQFIQSICFTVVTSFIEGSIITCDVLLASALEFSLLFHWVRPSLDICVDHLLCIVPKGGKIVQSVCCVGWTSVLSNATI